MISDHTVTYTLPKPGAAFNAPTLSSIMRDHAKTCDVHMGTNAEGRVIEIRVICSDAHYYDEQDDA